MKDLVPILELLSGAQKQAPAETRRSTAVWSLLSLRFEAWQPEPRRRIEAQQRLDAAHSTAGQTPDQEAPYPSPLSHRPRRSSSGSWARALAAEAR